MPRQAKRSASTGARRSRRRRVPPGAASRRASRYPMARGPVRLPPRKLRLPNGGGGVRLETVGDSNGDMMAQVTGGITQAEGSFDSVSTTGETDSLSGAGKYSLQLNTGIFRHQRVHRRGRELPGLGAVHFRRRRQHQHPVLDDQVRSAGRELPDAARRDLRRRLRLYRRLVPLHARHPPSVLRGEFPGRQRRRRRAHRAGERGVQGNASCRGLYPSRSPPP